MRLVIDTNVIVSAALWGGTPRKILQTAQLKHTLCFSLSILKEVERVFNYGKFQKRLKYLSFSLEEFMDRLTENGIVISDPSEENIIKKDPADNKFLACALACKAKFIISGDKHLLALHEYKNISIITPLKAKRLL